MIFPGLSTQIFSMFKCQKINGIDQGSLLVQDFSMYCNQDEHLIYSFLAFGFLILYIIGIPVTMFLLMWLNKYHLHNKTR